jgi:hypothetical protein
MSALAARWAKPSRRVVPRYFFTIRGRDRVKDDPHGTNLPDVAAALSNAERKIRELRKESGGYNNDPTRMMIVNDEAGHMVYCRFFRATNHLDRVVRPGVRARIFREETAFNRFWSRPPERYRRHRDTSDVTPKPDMRHT